MTRELENLKKRVVITGLGVVAPNGIGKDAFWESVVEGRSAIDYVTSFDVSDLYCQIAGQVRDFDPTDYMNAKAARTTGRFSQFAVASAKLAVADAELDLSHLDAFRMGAVFGSSLAGNGNISDEMYQHLFTRGARGLHVLVGNEMTTHAATSHVFIELGMQGPNASSATGCVSGLDAIAAGRDTIRSGQADVMVVGGSEACVSSVGMTLLCHQNVLTHRNDDPKGASRPYDSTRDGLVLSEGGGAVVLESAEHALDRGADIYAEVRGYGSTTEAQHLLVADPSGAELAHAFRGALLESRIAPEDIDYVCAHGISSRDYDAADTRALKLVLGDRAYNIPVSSIKSTTGQPFAAGGAWQAVAACMVLRTDVVPPTTNYRNPDPQCDLDYVPNRARKARVDTIMLNSHSFGGTHAALIMRRFRQQPG